MLVAASDWLEEAEAADSDEMVCVPFPEDVELAICFGGVGGGVIGVRVARAGGGVSQNLLDGGGTAGGVVIAERFKGDGSR